jgi:uncharacterized membrane protein YtjA (UPF0391 family)
MLRVACACLLVAMVAGVIGFGDVGVASAGTARIVFVVGIAAFIASVLLYASQGRTPRL